MTDFKAARLASPEDDISLVTLGTIFLRHRYLILGLTFLAGFLGLATGLVQPRTYRSTAVFLPETTDAGASGLAIAANQLGIRVPTGSSGWSALLYVEVLGSRDILHSIALDTVSVPELGGRYALADLLEVDEVDPRRREDRAIQSLRDVIGITDKPDVGTVEVSASTQWPTVSHYVVRELLAAVSTFNMEARSSRARAEREFVERQAAEAERDLRSAEDALQTFMQRNRVIMGAPELEMQLDRLQREVGLRQTVLTSLLQSREESRINEVRDVPVITVIRTPPVPVIPESRGALVRGLMCAVLGLVAALILAYLIEAARDARRRGDVRFMQFSEELRAALPRGFRRK